VVVANQAPTLPGDAVVVRAGEVGAVLLAPRDANGDELTLSAHSSSPSVSTAVRGRTLVIAPDATASGDVAVAVAVSDGHDGWAAASVAVRVLPSAPTGASRSLSPAGTRVSWTAAPTAGASYEVAVDGRPVCRTSTSVCAFEQVAGPARAVTVRTLGRDATSSPWTDVSLRGHGEVLVTTLYFASGSATLTPTDRRILTRAIGKVRRYGFARVSLAGYTDADGGYRFNLALSKRRTAAVAGYFRDHGRLGSVQSWHGESDPVASNGAPQGKARNRRVEVIVRY
jgi:outer membrane protein OmpA-like peptidoglycan-associated protein